MIGLFDKYPQDVKVRADQYDAVVMPPYTEGTDFSVLYHNEGYSTMCGHAIICLNV